MGEPMWYQIRRFVKIVPTARTFNLFQTILYLRDISGICASSKKTTRKLHFYPHKNNELFSDNLISIASLYFQSGTVAILGVLQLLER